MRAQVLLGLPLLICRDSQGRLAALRDICPHRGMPLLFGHFDGTILECCYHGWQFDMEGRCQHIPALVADSSLQVDKIGVATYPCQERDGYIWVYLPDPSDKASDRKSTRLNSSHLVISYAVFCLKKKKKKQDSTSAYFAD